MRRVRQSFGPRGLLLNLLEKFEDDLVGNVDRVLDEGEVVGHVLNKANEETTKARTHAACVQPTITDTAAQ